MSFKVEKLLIKNGEKSLVDISFEIKNAFALVGESGSGKSLTLKALLGLLPSNLTLDMSVDSSFELKRGKSVAIIVQNPFTALSPLTKIKKQFFIDIDRAEKYMEMVGLSKELLERFPSELSGGQLQRVVIAMALSLKPKLLLLDEPTTALDEDTKYEIISLLKTLQKKEGFLMLFVTHEIDITKDICQEIAILKDGKIVESGEILEVLEKPKESYTKSLIEATFRHRKFRQ